MIETLLPVFLISGLASVGVIEWIKSSFPKISPKLWPFLNLLISVGLGIVGGLAKDETNIYMLILYGLGNLSTAQLSYSLFIKSFKQMFDKANKEDK